MSILNDIRNMGTQSQTLVLSNQADGPAVAKASTFHSLGSKLGISSSLAKDAALADALKDAVAAEPRYFGVKNMAQDLVDSLAAKGPIQSKDIKSLIAQLDSITSPEEQKKTLLHETFVAIPSALKERVSAQPQGVQDAFHTAFKASMKASMESVDMPAALDAGVVAGRFSSKIDMILDELEFADIPEDQHAQVLLTASANNLDDISVEKYIDYLERIDDDPSISERNKGFLRNALISDGAPISEDKFEYFSEIRRSQTTTTAFVEALDEAGIRGHFTELGINPDKAFHSVKSDIIDTFSNRLLKPETAAITPEGCQAILDASIARYESAVQELGQMPDTPLDSLVKTTLSLITSPPKDGFITALNTAGHALGDNPIFMENLASLTNPNASVQNFIDTFSECTKAIYSALDACDQKLFPEMGSLKMPAFGFAITTALQGLSTEQQTAILDKLNSPEMLALNSYCLGAQSADPQTLGAMLVEVRGDIANMLGVVLEEAQLDPSTLEPTKVENLPLSLANIDSFNTAITGVAVNPSSPTTAGMQAKVNQVFDALLQTAIQGEMVKLRDADPTNISTFQKDITRGMAVSLPDGRILPRDFHKARELVTQFITGNSGASYDTLSPQDRNKVHILLANLSQETEKAATMAFSFASTTKSEAAFNPVYDTDMAGTRGFALSHTQDGGIMINYTANMNLHGVMYAHPTLNVHHLELDDAQSYHESYCHVEISGTELDRLASLDWESFTPNNERINPDKMFSLKETLDQTFCAVTTHTAKSRMHLVAQADV